MAVQPQLVLRKRTVLCSIAVAAVCCLGLACSSKSTESRSPAEFADPQLRQAVAQALGREGQALYRDEVAQLVRLECENCGIADVSGIEQLENLTSLDLGHNVIHDLRPLTRLKNLRTLLLFGNPLASIDSLANLATLRELRLGAVALPGLEPLGELAQLQQLYINSCGLTSIAPLSALNSLTRLVAFDNSLEDIAALAALPHLSYVNLFANQVADLAPLQQNNAFGVGDSLIVLDNPLTGNQVAAQIASMEQRGVVVLRSPQSSSGESLPNAIELVTKRGGW